MPRKPSAITEKQEAFVEGKLRGLSDVEAKVQAGLSATAATQNVAAVRAQLEAARRWLTSTTQITRLDVIEGVIDGIEMARMQGDAGNVIKGWTEVAKILGHYAPEVKKIELTMEQGRMRSKLEALSDDELFRISQGRVIDGDCQEVH